MTKFVHLSPPLPTEPRSRLGQWPKIRRRTKGTKGARKSCSWESYFTGEKTEVWRRRDWLAAELGPPSPPSSFVGTLTPITSCPFYT